jgi:hypothetical protein
VKTSIGRLAEFRCQMEIIVSGDGRNVAEVGGEVRKLRLRVFSPSVTTVKGGHRHAVTQVVNARRASSRAKYPGAQAEVLP